jgi:hypothetical protein
MLDGGFDVGDPVHASFGVAHPRAAPLEVGGGPRPFLLEPLQVPLLGVDALLGGVDGVVVRAAEARYREMVSLVECIDQH